MRLINNFYNIISISEIESDSCCFEIHLNSDHFIYKAHFPGEPITPGVCIIQIAKELISEIISKQVEVKRVKNVKFINTISPLKNPDIVFKINKTSFEDKLIKVQYTVFDAEKTFAKLSLELE